MRDSKLNDILRFHQLLNDLRKVERVVRVDRAERWENDLEHSYTLAMLAWYIASANRLSLDRSEIFKYALAHDIVEVYAGDTYIYSEDREHLDSKTRREAEALEKLKREFPEGEEMVSYAEAYIRRDTPESRFVYALDKIQPVLSIYLDDGRTWKEKNITLRMLIDHKSEKVALSPEILPYWNELVTLLRSEEKQLFPD